MAEINRSSPGNKQFLQQFERQRLNKLCHRVIDLRGKVAGECQAYLFGGKTHYLDDRGYLLVRQLLDRFNGRYTVGVYEAFQKAMQHLKSQDQETRHGLELEAKKSLLYCEASQVQEIPFDQTIQRQEARIQYATPVEIRLDDLLYTASTVDITTSAIRIVLKRAYTLQENDIVQISFMDLDSDLTNIEYQILKIMHDETHTFAVLVRDRTKNEAFTAWLDSWTQKHATPEYLDLDNELFNLATRYYQHLYTRSLTDAILWLSSLDDPEPVKAWHGNILEIQPYFKYFPIKQILDTSTPYLVMIEHGKDNCIAIPCQESELLAKLLTAQNDSKRKIFLLHPVQPAIDIHQFAEPLAKIANKDTDYAEKLKQKLISITMMVRLLDITTLCQNLSVSTNIASQLASYTILPHDYPYPDNQSRFHYSIHRKEPRFIIRTPITIHINGKVYETRSQNFSYQGIAFTLPEPLNLKPEMHFSITFDHWQKQTSRKYFEHVPFILKHIHQGTVHAERFVHHSSAEFNTFLMDIIEQNEHELRKDILDTLICQESHIFGSILTHNIQSIPVFLGIDNQKKRIFQAVATTPNNQAKKYLSLWSTLGLSVNFWAEKLKASEAPLCFGIYCYQRKNQQDEWVVATDFDFNSAQQKNIFIARALDNMNHLFFYCSVSAIKPMLLDDEQALNEQLAVLRKHSPHKVKQIKSILSDLFAIGEMTDITDVISVIYRSQDAIIK